MLWASIQQTWEPFVLVIGLLLIGHIAASDGIFEAAGSRLSHLRGGPVVLFVSMMILTALVTATLNLDTSVVFLTPVLLSTASQRSVDEKAFLYGSIFMANASSLLLLGSNLTNVLVFSRSGVQGTTFTRTMLLPWLVSVVLTTAVVLAWRWRALSVAPKSFHGDAKRLTLGPGLLGIAGATILMLALSRPAVPVLAVGLGVVGLDLWRRRGVRLMPIVRSANLVVIGGLFVFATCVSVSSRYWHLSQHLVGSTTIWQTAGISALLSNVINNLPAAALLSAKLPPHPYSLLLGLNLGPNLTVLGALSSVLWLKVSKREGATPSVWTFSKIGAVVTLVTLIGCLWVLQV